MRPKGSSRPLLLVLLAVLLLGAQCIRGQSVKPLLLHQALDDYFDGGYIPYSLPGRGPIYEPGTIIRYQKKAEVLVRQRGECFPLAAIGDERFPPTVKWSKDTEVSGALSAVIPQAAAAQVAAELKAQKVEAANLQLGSLTGLQIPEADVRDRQRHPDFPAKCKDEYGKNHILIMGTIGSRLVRYRLQDSTAVSAVLKALTQLNIGGNMKFTRSTTGENALEVVSEQPTVLGYLAYELKLEGDAGRPIGTDARLVVQKLSTARALEMKATSD